ncbi:hypothetical protein [Paenibacillus pasadenensis]|uniref:hypothetical protein n=1 Tax=Paenibacillus pasadenensis TaxID=217090 RepID=UPI0020414755|nr:hypothetical protein [Paenibacillus pasadenensis]
MELAAENRISIATALEFKELEVFSDQRDVIGTADMSAPDLRRTTLFGLSLQELSRSDFARAALP